MKDYLNKSRDETAIIDVSALLSPGKIGLWKWHIQKNHFLINSSCKKSGHDKSAIITVEDWLSDIYAADRDNVRQSIMNHIKSNNADSIEIEFRIRKSAGEYAWLFLSGIVTEYKDSKPVIMDGIILDITGRKKIENELYFKKEEIEALYEESEAQNEEMSVILDELQSNQIKLENAHQRLIMSEKKFRNIFEHSPIGIIQSTLTGKIIRANDAFCRMFGYKSQDDLLECLPDTAGLYSDRKIRNNLLSELSGKDLVHASNLIVLKKDKSHIYTNGYFLKMTDEYTGEKFITTFVEDITRLKSSQHEHDLFFSNSGDILSITDSEGRIIQANPAWTSDLGWDTGYLKSIRIRDLVHPEDQSKTEKFMEKLNKSGKVLTLVNRFRNKHGEYRIIRWNCKAFHEIDTLFFSGRDETDRYEAELDLKQMWDRLDIALKAAAIGLWDFNLQESSLSINMNMAEFLGLETHIIKDVQTACRQYIHESDYESSLNIMKKFLKNNNGTYTDEFRIKMPDGKYRWFFSRGKVVEYDSSGTPLRIAGSAMDITEQKEAELKKMEIELKMQQAQKLESLGVLAGGIAHDFNNLLTGILGNTDILLYELPDNSDHKKRLMDIKKTAKIASELTHQMLAYSGKGSFIIEQINLNDLFLDMIPLLEVSISKKVKLQYDLMENPPKIKGDTSQIRQIIINLVLNASDSIANIGVITVRTSNTRLSEHDKKNLIMKSGSKTDNFILLEVTDTGCGIENDKLEHIFDPFYTTKFTGRGLGLAAVSGIIRSHNAGLTVNSRTGEGTCFKVFFPVTEEISEPEIAPQIKLPYFNKPDPLILIADDEKYIRELTGKMLIMSGYKACHAGNGHELLKIFHEKINELSCIILDLTMPEIDGYEALKEIRRTDSKIPVVITSGYSENEINLKFTGQKVSGFLQKPFTLEELISAIEEAMI